ncbi:biotin/lipoyl-binding protein [Mumia flava]|uniref:Biotin/lipoyl-binding protein n=1 Tax=Mumia flava TaxID=1348852 RepID=A0A2M9B7I6_9ACTN|nr:HlyD family efflux transporter periplasmic adaptor subunit [Mumia flava]PJJ53910.1 biotin/lipoyl-binding protein [Mumia flava]
MIRIRRRPVGKRTVAVGVAAVTAAAVGLVVASSSASGARYRTAQVAIGSVEQTVSYDGTVAAANRSDLVFATDGSVKKVKVGVGDEVRAGQTLGTLETRELTTAVIKARADLADAKAYLDDVEDGQIDTVTRAVTGVSTASASTSESGGSAVRLAAYTVAASAPASTPASTSATTTLARAAATSAASASAAATSAASASAASTSPGLAAKLAELKEEQEAVTTAQSAATEAIAASKAALEQQKSTCADESTPSGSGDGGDGGDGSDGDGSGDAGTASDASAGLSPACQQALQDVQDAQDVVADRQDELQSALEALGGTLDDAVAQLGEDASSGNGGSGNGGSGNGGSGNGSGGNQPGGNQPDTESGDGQPDGNGQPDGQDQGGAPSQGTAPDGSSGQQAAPDGSAGSGSMSGGTGEPTSTEATAADLASAQADVDSQKAALAEAKADRKAATLTAPYAGTVMAVDVAAGDAVSTSDRAFVLIGEGDTTVNLSVPVDDLSAVQVGQSATVTPSVGDPVAAEVTKIGLVPEASDTSSNTTYQVTLRVDGTLSSPEGSTVSVALVTATSADVVTVPSTAVTRMTDSEGTVLVVDDGEVTRTPVTLGAVGGSRIAVTDGLEVGQDVAIADLDAVLPSSDDQGSQDGGFGGGGFGGAGGGFPGAGGLSGGGGFPGGAGGRGRG